MERIRRDVDLLLRRATDLESRDPVTRRGAIRWFLVGSDGVLGRLAEVGLTARDFPAPVLGDGGTGKRASLEAWLNRKIFVELAAEVEEALASWEEFKASRRQNRTALAA